MESDEQLLSRFLKGDERAFELIVERYEVRLRGLAFGFVRDASLAEDIAQDAFMRVYQGASRFRGSGSVRSWMFRIVANRARDELRRIRSRRESALEDFEAAEGVRSDVGSVAPEAEGRLVGHHLARALAQIRQEYRSPLLLREVSGMSYEEIAQSLGWPTGTVKTRIHRGRLELRALLAPLKAGDRNDM